MNSIFIISGKAGSGKDTFADCMIKQIKKSNIHNHVFRIAYADALRHDAQKYFDVDVNNKNNMYRTMMQYIGTDIVRRRMPNYWVNTVISKLKLYGDIFDTGIITDARYINEVQLIKDYANCEHIPCISIRIERPETNLNMTIKQMKHSSETELDDFEFDYHVINDKGIKNLNSQAVDIYHEVFNYVR